jgi:hypothetical protein
MSGYWRCEPSFFPLDVALATRRQLAGRLGEGWLKLLWLLIAIWVLPALLPGWARPLPP